MKSIQNTSNNTIQETDIINITQETTNLTVTLDSTINDSTKITGITDIQTSKTVQNYTDISSPFILGFDKYVYSSVYKKITFNCYFSITKEIYFPKVIYSFVLINYRSFRYLQSNENGNEESKSIYNLVDSNINKQIKYECELETNGKDILNIKSLDLFEYDSKKVEIQSSSFLYSLYKNNIQNVQGDIFNKPLFFLKDSIVKNNEKEFNITGNLKEDKFNYNKLILQFHSNNKNNNESANSNCLIIKLIKWKRIYIKMCS